MKIKHFFPAAALAIATTACTSDDVVSTPQTADTPISFNAYTGNMTRAMHSYSSTNLPEEFTVWAFDNSGKNYFDSSTDGSYNGDVIQRSGTSPNYTWGPKDPNDQRYWPKYPGDGWSLCFFASADAKSYNSYSNLVDVFKPSYVSNYGFKYVLDNFKVESNTINQRDPLYAYNMYIPQSKSNEAVSLQFLHALSQICFRAQNNDEGTEYLIKSVEVHNITGQGYFEINPSTGNTDVSKPSNGTNYSNNSLPTDDNRNNGGFNYYAGWKFYKPGDTNYDSYSQNTSYTTYFGFEQAGVTLPQAVKQDGVIKVAPVNLSVPGATEATDAYTEGVDENYNPIVKYHYSDHALNLIPQQRTSNEYDENYGAYLIVNFVAKGKSESQKINLNVNWLPGYRYIYTLTFTAGEPVTYSVTVADRNEDIVNGNSDHEGILMREANSTQTALYFADRNLGATSPEATGYYYIWGNAGYSSSNFNADNVYDALNNPYSAYGLSMDELKSKGFIRNGILSSSKDAATNSLGGFWRIPTFGDWDWMAKNCTWEPVKAKKYVYDLNESGQLQYDEGSTYPKEKYEEVIIGFNVTSTTTKNTIYLPATGYLYNKLAEGSSNTDPTLPVHAYGNENQYNEQCCYYWSSTPYNNTNDSYYLNIDFTSNPSSPYKNVISWNRFYGMPIRPVSY